MLPRRAMTTAPPCSAALPTIATITAETKKSLRPAWSANDSSEPTSTSATNAVTTVAAPSTASARLNGHVVAADVVGHVQVVVPLERPPRGDHVDDEKDDRDDEGGDLERVPLAVSRPARDGGDREQADGESDEPDRGEARRAVDRPPPAEREREAENEQQVADDASRQRAAHDLRQPLVDRDQRDDQLGRVAEGRVQEPADTRPRVVGSVLGRLADQPCERDERDRRQRELGRVVEHVRVVESDGERSEKKRRPQELSDHDGNPTPPPDARTRLYA